MIETIKLGGNIELVNAGSIDGGSLVVLKKIIGNYARKFSERGAESISVAFDGTAVSIDVMRNGDRYSSLGEKTNLFFSLDSALKELDSQF
ncbi:hypothetical protein KY329_05020 [Candidatus Woesearchaeota archaeon]|nr:hypothetical protein [Candidatus Woesearchaeota archaeon]